MFLVLSGTRMISYLAVLVCFLFLSIGCDRPTHQIHMDSFVADTHNDILLRAMEGEDILSNHPDAQSDLEKFKLGGVDLQVFSIWVSPNEFEES